MLFAGWQYNDPDPYIWVPIYGFVALEYGLAAFNRCLPYRVLLAGAVLLTIFMLTYIPGSVQMDPNGRAQYRRIDESRTPLGRVNPRRIRINAVCGIPRMAFVAKKTRLPDQIIFYMKFYIGQKCHFKISIFPNV